MNAPADLAIDGARVVRLGNGLTIVTQAMPQLATAALGVWVGVGSRHESEAQHGLAHLLEHMAFKGTARRTARMIAEEMEAVGGDLNAATGIEQTSYTARVLAEHVPLALDMLADILLGSTFPDAELAREKNVILQEIGAVEDKPDDLIYDVFLETAFPHQPLGRPILGTPASVSAFTGDDLRAYLAQHYTPDRMVVGAVGAIDHDAVVALVARLFGGTDAGVAGQSQAPALYGGGEAGQSPTPALYGGGERRIRRRLEQTHIVLGLPGVALTDPTHDAAQLFTIALGGGVSSRLFQEVREERGLAYAVEAFHWGFADTGIFGIGAGCEPRDARQLAEVALDCLARAAKDLSAEELARAKAQMRMAVLAARESPGARVDQLARHLLTFGRIIPRAEIEARIAAVDVDRARAAGAAIAAGLPTAVGIGPTDAWPSLSAITRQLAAA